MWKLYLIKFLYYMLFGIIFLISIIIFFEILNIGIMKEFIGDYILNLFDRLNF